MPTPTSPCTPSPCGTNAVCREQNGAGSCSCLPEYIGNPYEGCRPECVHNTDCPSNKACMRNKCQDPCPGTCGQNADCQVVNHLPTCTCRPGYTGDPFRYCSIQPPQRKGNFVDYTYSKRETRRSLVKRHRLCVCVCLTFFNSSYILKLGHC